MEHSQKLTIYVGHKNLNKYQKAEITQTWDAGVAQLVKHPALDFSSDHDLTVHEFKPPTGLCADSAEPA